MVMKTFLRVTGRVVLILLATLVAAYALKGLVGTAEVARTKERVRADIERGLPAGVGDATKGQKVLRQQLREYGEPTHSWRELRCDFSSRDSGWIALSYQQDCVVRAVDLYAAQNTNTTGAACDDLPAESSLGAPQYSGRVVLGPTTALTADERDWRCPGDLVVGTNRFHATRALSGARPRSLSSSPAWVVVETTTEVSSTDIGCNPWGVIFCSQPYDEPVLPR
jgi:hypothetical protein